MPQAETEQTPAQRIAAFAEARGLTLTAAFVPLSQSRNAKPGSDGKVWQSLNWRVTLLKNGKPVLETDYGQGVAHCPAHKINVPRLSSGVRDRYAERQRESAIAAECETGKIHMRSRWGGGGDVVKTARDVPPPALVDVLWSLSSDAGVLNASGFDDWAAEYGYDTDSRQAEATYRACLEIALKLRSALGEDGLSALADAGQDY